jgi:Protein of unknown function (DUF5818)
MAPSLIARKSMARASHFLSALFLSAALTLFMSAVAFGQTDPPPASPGPGSQTTPPTFPPGTAHQGPEDSKPPKSKAGKERQFVGTVVKESAGYSLRVGELSYKLDDQERARSYEGRSVKVVGTLDKQTNTITIEKIE